MIWGGFHRLDQKYFFKVSNPAIGKIKDKKKIHNKTIMFSVASSSLIYEAEVKKSLTGSKFHDHSKKIDKLIQYIIDLNYFENVYIKVKGFGFKLFKNYEYFLVPFLNKNHKPKNNKVQYLTEGQAEEYYNFIDLHVCDSLSTTLINSISANQPTIAFMDTDIYQIKKEYKELYSKLKYLGIIIEKEIDVKHSIKEIILKKNWNSKNFQLVRKEFTENFHYSEEKRIQNLNDLLVKIIKN